MSAEQRQERRIANDIQFFVHVHECDEDAGLVGESVSAEAVDVSAHGLQFHTGDLLYSDSLLDVTIGVGEPFAMYLLRGEIRWVTEVDDEYFIGVKLLPEDGRDLDKWIGNFTDTFGDEPGDQPGQD